MNASHILVFISLFLISFKCASGGVDLLEGITTDNWQLIVRIEPEVSHISMNKRQNKRESLTKSFDNEKCQFMTEMLNGKTVYSFTCVSKGKSPLAGTMYLGYDNPNSNCEAGEPAVIFKCIWGCGKTSTAPRSLTQGYWEC